MGRSASAGVFHGAEKPRAPLGELRLVLLHHCEQVGFDYLPEPLVHRAVLPGEVPANETLDPAGESADAGAGVDAGALPDVSLLLAALSDGADIHGILLAREKLRHV